MTRDTAGDFIFVNRTEAHLKRDFQSQKVTQCVHWLACFVASSILSKSDFNLSFVRIAWNTTKEGSCSNRRGEMQSLLLAAFDCCDDLNLPVVVLAKVLDCVFRCRGSEVSADIVAHVLQELLLGFEKCYSI